MAATIDAPTPARATPATATTRTPGWLADSRNRYFAAGGAVVAIALIVWLVVMSGQRKEAFASRALDQARGIAESGNLPLAATELQKITTTYSGTRAAQEAVISLNQVRLVNGQYELAAIGLQDFLKSGPEPYFRATANGLLGRALENAKRPVDAARAYVDASQAAEVEYLKADYLMDAGRAYRDGGEKAKALEVYQRVLKDYPKSSSKIEAEVRVAELTAQAM
jgi:outer membrane protein assembly factor BamD (BamD/ComL family)